MSAARRLALPVVVLAGATLVAFLFSANRVALSYPEPGKPAVKWEYQTATMEPGELQARLTELGNDGWEVFSIERSGLVIEQDPAPKTRLVADKYQVTAKRPAGQR